MFLKLLQKACHGWVALKVIEVVVDPEQHYSCYLWETMWPLLSDDRSTSSSSHRLTLFTASLFRWWSVWQEMCWLFPLQVIFTPLQDLWRCSCLRNGSRLNVFTHYVAMLSGTASVKYFSFEFMVTSVQVKLLPNLFCSDQFYLFIYVYLKLADNQNQQGG